jgi:hypothetical protein
MREMLIFGGGVVFGFIATTVWRWMLNNAR